MMDFLDSAGNELLYWPVGAVKAGEDSPTLDIQVLCEPGSILSCETNGEGTVFAKEGAGAYRDLSTNPFDLTPFGVGYHTFTIYFHASVDVEEMTRVPLTVGLVVEGAAGWV
jgi:hypothetical protein